jgi:hypothetical protein
MKQLNSSERMVDNKVVLEVRRWRELEQLGEDA